MPRPPAHRSKRSAMVRAALGLLLGAGCAVPAAPLGDGATPVGEPVPGPVACPAPAPEAEREALRALAEAWAPQLVEGRRVGPETVEIDRVPRGFDQWTRGRVAGGQHARAALEGVPIGERWRFAVDGWVRHEGAGGWSGALTPIRPLEAGLPEQALLGLGPEVTAVVAARLDRVEGNQLYFRRLETLRGEAAPERFYALMVLDSPLPVRPTSTWLIGARSFEDVDAQEAFLAHWVDIRRDTPENRQAALTTDESADISDAAFDEARTWKARLPWRLAPFAVETRVVGLLSECTTGLGGLAELHAVEADLRGGGASGRVAVGGHGFSANTACGERARIAVAALDPGPGGDFSCPGACGRPEYYPGQPPLARIREGEPGFDRSARDAVAPGPTVFGPPADAPAYPVRPDGPWSASPSMAFTLAATDALVPVEVLAVAPLGAGLRVDVATSDGDARRLFLPCPDPRFRAGARLVLPQARLSFSDSILVPGLVLERDPDAALGRFVLRMARRRARALR